MRYAKIENGAVAKYPYSFREWRKDNPNVSPPKDPSDEWLAGVGVVKIVEADRPDPSDPITKNVVEGTPSLVEGVWTQTWVEEDATSEQIAARQKRASYVERRAEVKADQFVTAFLKMSPAEVVSYVNVNVTNLASAKTVLTKLALIVLILARREFDE